MKRIIRLKNLLLLCCIWLATGDTKAQITNPSFEDYCGVVINDVYIYNRCPSFGNSCIPGWRRSHGSPQVGTTGAIHGNNYITMWARYQTINNTNAPRSEGILTDYTFHKYRKYRVCMLVRNDVNAGRLIVWATRDVPVVPDSHYGCGDPDPGTTRQTIYDVSLTFNSGWVMVSTDFVADDTYNQLVIFPYNETETTVWMNVDNVQVTEICPPDVVFNMTTNTTAGTIPVGWYVGYNIYAGSSAGGGTLGAGTVQSAPNENVTMEGANLVILQPNFVAAPTGGYEFHAYIDPCTSPSCGNSNAIVGNTEGIAGDADEPATNGGESVPADRQSNTYNELYAGAQVYPNPTNGTLRVITQYNAAAEYEITTITGQVLQKGKVESNEALDIGEYPQGIYLLRITEGITGRQSTLRIVKQ